MSKTTGWAIRLRIASATIPAIVWLLLGGTATAAACRPGIDRSCVKLDQVQDISRRIVSDEEKGRKAKQVTPTTDDTTPYTGPTLRLSPMAKTPTVGYKWSLE
jgi:hypothetical protein